MKSLRDLIDKKKTRRPQNISDKDVFYVFRKIIKEEFGLVGASKFTADYFARKTLHIKSTSSNWASELWTNKNRILRKMNEELGDNTVLQIKLK